MGAVGTGAAGCGGVAVTVVVAVVVAAVLADGAPEREGLGAEVCAGFGDWLVAGAGGALGVAAATEGAAAVLPGFGVWVGAVPGAVGAGCADAVTAGVGAGLIAGAVAAAVAGVVGWTGAGTATAAGAVAMAIDAAGAAGATGATGATGVAGAAAVGAAARGAALAAGIAGAVAMPTGAGPRSINHAIPAPASNKPAPSAAPRHKPELLLRGPSDKTGTGWACRSGTAPRLRSASARRKASRT